ncbi:MAG: hypothetical protein RL641_860 [Candidatus Parcubacteria bacterium]
MASLLLLECESFGDFGVGRFVLALEEFHVGTSVCNHLDETTAGMVIQLVFLEMF